jgi:hypothetical protein
MLRAFAPEEESMPRLHPCLIAKITFGEFISRIFFSQACDTSSQLHGCGHYLEYL